jgi:putative ABC transport system substrate-binding protein
VVGAYDAVDPAKHITDIPVVFTLVAAPVLAKIVPDLKSSGPQRDRRLPRGAHRGADPRHGVVPPDQVDRHPLHADRAELGGRRRRGARRLQAPRLPGDRQAAAPRREQEGDRRGRAEMVRELKQQKVEWLYLPPDSFLGTQTKSVIIPAAMQVGLPTFASTEQLMETGALTGLISRYHAIGQFTAYKAEQILINKVPPSRIPVETLTRFTLQVRMDVAEQLKMRRRCRCSTTPSCSLPSRKSPRPRSR